MKPTDLASWKLCNCCVCHAVLLGESMARRVDVLRHPRRPEFVAGRRQGRPFCRRCLAGKQPLKPGVYRGMKPIDFEGVV